MAGWILPTITTTYIQITAVYLAVFFAYYPTTQVLFERWLKFDESLSHGLIIVGMSIHLSYKYLSLSSARVSNLSRQGQTPNRLIPTICLIFLSSLWLILSIANISVIEQLLMPPILLSILSILWGVRAGYALLLPITFLYFAIPLWDYLNQSLVDLSSFAVGNAVETFGITAFISGPKIELTYGALLIAGGCSGLRYFIIGLALSFYLAIDSKPAPRQKALIILLTTLSSLLANWIRIFAIVLAADWTNMESPLIKDHEYFGWFVFIICIAPALWWGSKRLQPIEAPKLTVPTPNIKIACSTLLLLLSAFTAQTTIATINTQNEPPNLKISGFKSLNETNAWKSVDVSLHRTSFISGIRIHENIYLNTKQSPNEKLVPFVSDDSPLKDPYCSKQLFMVGEYWTESYRAAKILQIPAALQGKSTFLAIQVKGEQNINCKAIQSALDSRADNLRHLLVTAFL